MDLAKRGIDLSVREERERIKVASNCAREKGWVCGMLVRARTGIPNTLLTLRYHHDVLPQILQANQPNVNIVDQDLALLGLQSSE